MNPGRRRAVAAFMGLWVAGAAHAQRMNTAMHASACERLSTLAERIAKSQVQLAEGVLAERSRRALRDSEREMDSLLPLAAELATDAETRDNFVLMRLLWKELRVWARKSPTRENARQLCERAEELAWVAAKTARALPTAGTAQRDALTAMQAATLAQRVARLQLLKRIAAADPRRDADLVDGSARLGSVLSMLASSPHTLDLEDDLRMARTQYDFLVAAMRESAPDASAAGAETVAKSADYITDSMERAARLYENGG